MRESASSHRHAIFEGTLTYNLRMVRRDRCYFDWVHQYEYSGEVSVLAPRSRRDEKVSTGSPVRHNREQAHVSLPEGVPVLVRCRLSAPVGEKWR